MLTTDRIRINETVLCAKGRAGEEKLKELLWSARDNYSADAAWRAAVHWDQIQHPLHGMGLLEDAVVQIAGLTGSENVSLEKKAVVIFCSDNGVVEEQVTQTGSYVTGVVARNLALGRTGVCRMALRAGAEVIPVDMGIRDFPETEGIWNCRIGNGTGNILRGSAMDRADAVKAILTGIEIAGHLKQSGYKLLGAGEMGIGNTTTSSACASILLGVDPAEVTGKGAGLSEEGLKHKISVIRDAIQRNGLGHCIIKELDHSTVKESDRSTINDLHHCAENDVDVIEVLRRVGGYDLCGMCGLFLGGLIYRIPVLIDGVVSGTAALAAGKICPASLNAMLASHVSSEPAGSLILSAMGKKPLISAELHYGEGTGTVLAMPMLDMALMVYGGCTFEEGGVEAYHPM